MISFLDLLGIHEWDIETTNRNITDELEYLGLEDKADELAERTMQYLCEREITEDLGNTIIDCMLEAAAGIVEERVGSRPEMELYCNGADSHFSVLNQNVRESLHFASVCGLDYEFVRWLKEEIPDQDDFELALETDVLYPAFEALYKEGASLYWTSPEDNELSEEEIEQRLKACEEDPEDIDNFFFVGMHGKIWTKEEESI